MTCGCGVERRPGLKPGPASGRKHIVLTNVPPSVMKALGAAPLKASKVRNPSRFAARHLNAEHARMQRAIVPLLKAYAAAVDDVLTRHGVYDALPR